MKIGLYNLESQYINIALEKIKIHHQRKGDVVEGYLPLMHSVYDKIYASSIFSWTDKSYVPGDAIVGGTGFDIPTGKFGTLPPEIDKIKPHLNIGFTTRGCIRNCKFCYVPAKEGKMRVVGDLLDLWNNRVDSRFKKDNLIIILDNNILALPEHFKFICKQARENNFKLDFNQGLDHRLLTEDMCKDMATISHEEYHFAFDLPQYHKSVIRASKLLHKYNINRSTWFVLVGFNTSYEQDLERLFSLKAMNEVPFVMRYNKTDNPMYLPFMKWANYRGCFHARTFKDVLYKYFTGSHMNIVKAWVEILDKMTKGKPEPEINEYWKYGYSDWVTE